MSEQPPQPRPDRGGRRVLVVEADMALRRIITLGLRRRGLEVIEARTLGEAWERERVPPAAIVLDIGLGAVSEWMLLRALGGHAALRQAPLVLLAWECPATLAPVSFAPGHTAPERICLTKPFDARALYAAVERLVAAPVQVQPVATTVCGTVPTRAACLAPGLTDGPVARDMPALIERQMVGPSAGPSARSSAWPLVAAGAATLSMAGFLIRPAFAVAGLVLLVVALLWWSTASAEPATTG